MGLVVVVVAVTAAAAAVVVVEEVEKVLSDWAHSDDDTAAGRIGVGVGARLVPSA